MRRKLDENERGEEIPLRTVCGAGLALAVVAVVVAGDDRGVNVDRVGDGLAEAMSSENHFWAEVLLVGKSPVLLFQIESGL